MREILFIGKRKDNGEWVCGLLGCNYFRPNEKYYYIHNCETDDIQHEVILETIGQFTGLTDKNGTKIFEGDILRLCNATYPIKVFWDCLGWKFLSNGKLIEGAFDCDIKHDMEICEIIGNIHDNPELLEESNEN